MSVPHRVVSALPPGTAVSRYIIAKALGRGDMYTELMIAEQWRDTPQVRATLEVRTKAAVAAGSTTDATWAGPLAAYGIQADANTILFSKPSIFGQLQSGMQSVPLHVRIARETGTGVSGAWVAAGDAIPVKKTAFATIIQEHYKFGLIAVLAEELVKTSSPAAEATIRRKVLGPDGGLSASLDTQLLLPTVTLSAGLRPASLTNGSTERVTTGSTAVTIAADLGSMLGSVTTPGPLVWVMKSKTLYYLALTLGSQAAGLPNTLFGIPVIASNNSPAQIALLDPSQMLYSDSGQFDLDTSEESLLQLDDAPTNPPVAGTT